MVLLVVIGEEREAFLLKRRWLIAISAKNTTLADGGFTFNRG
jgi:hypothetical protein